MKKREVHHIWCNWMHKDVNECTMCDRLYKEYPMDCSPDELIKKHFPDVVVKK